jgi:hypothetical protein
MKGVFAPKDNGKLRMCQMAQNEVGCKSMW